MFAFYLQKMRNDKVCKNVNQKREQREGSELKFIEIEGKCPLVLRERKRESVARRESNFSN